MMGEFDGWIDHNRLYDDLPDNIEDAKNNCAWSFEVGEVCENMGEESCSECPFRRAMVDGVDLFNEEIGK